MPALSKSVFQQSARLSSFQRYAPQNTLPPSPLHADTPTRSACHLSFVISWFRGRALSRVLNHEKPLERSRRCPIQNRPRTAGLYLPTFGARFFLGFTWWRE